MLLDTHLLIWSAIDSPSLPLEARRLLTEPESELRFSAASIWEVAIKHALGREDFCLDPLVLRRGLLEAGFTELAVTGRHAAGVALLPKIHREPFDRLLVAQAVAEGITLLTSDRLVASYPGPIRLLE